MLQAAISLKAAFRLLGQLTRSIACIAAITFVYSSLVSVNTLTVALTMLLAIHAIASRCSITLTHGYVFSVGAVYDRARSLNLRAVRGHRPCLQGCWATALMSLRGSMRQFVRKWPVEEGGRSPAHPPIADGGYVPGFKNPMPISESLLIAAPPPR